MNLNVIHDKENQKFITKVDNKESTIDYEKIEEGKLDYKRTYVPEELRKKGIGRKLVEDALDYAKENGLKVKPTCTFVKNIMEENKEKYEDIIV